MSIRYGPKYIQKFSKYVKNAKMSKNDPHPFLDPPKNDPCPKSPIFIQNELF
jgi:hypothetical protein